MIKDVLLKAINLNLKDHPDLRPFLKKADFMGNKIDVTFISKANFIDPKTRKVITKTLTADIIEAVNNLDGFLDGVFQDDLYIVSFDSPHLPLLEKLVSYLSSYTNTLEHPHNQEELHSDQKQIEIIETQIEESRKQADAWAKDLIENKQPALQAKLDANKVFNEVIEEAKSKKLL